MKNIPAALTGGAMTLARCWRIRRADGVVLGFTDHDQDLIYDGVTHAAIPGFEASAMEAELGFAIAGGEASGVLASPGLMESDIVNGRYDGARVEIDLVDWTALDQRVRLEAGVIGEIRRAGSGFAAEIRSLAHRLDEERGRLFRASCAADLGDAACGISLEVSKFRFDGVVKETDGRLVIVLDGAFRTDAFNGGTVQFTNGANQGATFEIRLQTARNAGAAFTLWQPTGAVIAVGDTVTLRVGCDKRLATCRDVFQNTLNFRGFPHMPGNDFVVASVADGEAGMDGGSFFR